MHVKFRLEIDSRMVSLSLIGTFLTKLTFLNQMSVFSRNWKHHWKCREQTENFQKIMVIIFWNFTMFYKRPDKPQVKRNVISSRENLVHELLRELPNGLRLRIFRNEEILGKS